MISILCGVGFVLHALLHFVKSWEIL
jgi:hypothetical protein